ncbi:MAG TPA: tetratricopeptide repeat protein [Longimicrobiales bacterium]
MIAGTRDWTSRRSLALLVALAAVLPFANSLLNGFAYDDVAVVHDDPRVHGLGRLADILLKPYWASYGRELGLYRPLTSIGFALQWTIGGGAPWIFHAANVALHALACVLLFLLLQRLAGRAGAFVGALLFAVHSVHTEAVANVVGQAELIAACGVLGAALLWSRRPAGEPPGAGVVAGVAAGYAVALLSKESAITAPALLLALDLAQRRVPASGAGVAAWARQVAPAMAALTGVALAFLALRYHVLGSLRGGDVAPSIPFLAHDHFWMSLRVWPEYARLLLFPQDLSSDYSPAVILPVHGWTAATSLGALLLLGVLALALLTPTLPEVGLPAAWFLISILVVSNLFFPVGVTLAERILYLPSAALAFAIALAWAPLRRRYPPRLLAGVTLVLVAALAVRTWVRNPDWRDQDAVVAAMVRDHPESYRAQWNTAVRAFARGDRVGAAQAWELTYRLWPEDSHMLTEFGGYNIAIGRADRALFLLDRARAIHAGDARTEEFRANAFLVLGRPREALQQAAILRGLLGAAPAVDEISARAYIGLGRYDSAALAWRRVVTAYPAGWLQWSGLGRSLAHIARYGAALMALDTAVARAGKDTAALRQIRGFRELTLHEQAASRR